MNIVLYVPMWPPTLAPNGIVTYASVIVPALRRLGHTVHIITPVKTGSDLFTIELVRPSIFELTIARFIKLYSDIDCFYYIYTRRILRTLRKLTEKNTIDIIEMEESFGWCAAVSEKSAVPVVVRLHGPWFLVGSAGNIPMDTLANRSRLKSEGKGISLAAGVSAPSHYVLSESEKYYRRQYANASIIPNSIQQYSDDYLWASSNAEWNRLLFVGRFDLVKGADIVLEAFVLLAKEIPELVLDFVGPDNGLQKENGTNIKFDQHLAKFVDQNIATRISYHGVMNRGEIDALRRKACITVVASRNEMFPYSVLEALSLGCPLVATAVGGIPELINDGKTGLLARRCEPESIAHACRLFLSDRQLAARVGKAAAVHAKQNYGSLSIARRTVEYYERVLRSNT